MEKMEGKTLDLTRENINTLKRLFPEVVIEGKVDFEKLKLVLGEEVDDRKEKYEFTWHGKAQSLKLAQTPSTGTLRPDIESSKNWDSTENLYIEGDNLEVLKLLQKSYFGKIKMIYIDPPYNTGHDFVYKDDFKDNVRNYKQVTNQVTKSNTEVNGRYHTDWLNMMYPRIKLSRNLLKEDGLIFISISDKEYSNLKKVCDEIFGEENFIATLIWDRNHSAQAGIFKVYHEYVLVYAKDISNISVPRSLTNELFEAGAMKKQSARHPVKEFTFPRGTRWDAVDGTELTGEWGGTEKVTLIKGKMICENGKLKEDVTLSAAYTQYNQMYKYFYGDRKDLVDSRGQKIVEFYLNSSGKVKVVKERGVETPQTTQKFGTQGHASVDLAQLFDINDSPIDSPKPINMIKKFLAWFTDSNDIILDFFSGSATTAHSVMEMNSEDGSNRKYIMIQLPELLDEESELYKSGYKTISDIGLKRIELAGHKIFDNTGKTDLDIGFKVFKLDSSNLKTWDPDAGNLEQDLFDLQDNIKDGRSKEDLLYEILLKVGIPLTTPIEEVKLGDKVIYNVGFGGVLLCLEDEIDLDTVQELIKLKPEDFDTKVIFKETGFLNDSVKTNAIQTLKKNGITDVRSV